MPTQENDAHWVSQIVPETMLAGRPYDLCVTMRNVGSEMWVGGSGIALGICNGTPSSPDSKLTWGLDIQPIPPGEAIAPGNEFTFALRITAPADPGSYQMRTRMLQNDAWFGETSHDAAVRVEHNDAAFVSQLVPEEMACGSKYEVAVAMRNTGTTIWSAAEHYSLGHCGHPHTSTNEHRWTTARALLSGEVVINPGDTAIFRFEVTAPAQPGIHNFRWRMLQEEVEWFGEASVNVAITCSPAPEWPARIETVIGKLEHLIEVKVKSAVTQSLLAQAVVASSTSKQAQPDDSQPILDEAMAAVDAIFKPWDREDSPGCVVAVSHAGKLLYARGYGMANVENSIPLSPASIFPVGSLAKQFVALAILLLKRDGKLTLEDPIRLYVPELPLFANSITLRHLLHHTSGLQHDALLHVAKWNVSPVAIEHPFEIAVRQETKEIIPGDRFHYSQAGYMLLELVIQRVTGGSLGNYVDAHIFAPLGMTSSVFCSDPAAIIHRRVSAYRNRAATHFALAEPDFVKTPASNLFTSAQDMLRWDRNFLAGEVGGTLIEEMQQRGKLNNGCRVGYACGLMTGHKGVKTFEHGGIGLGCRSYYVRFVQSEISVVVFTNIAELNPIPLAHSVARIQKFSQR